jgi:hypothetical protein
MILDKALKEAGRKESNTSNIEVKTKLSKADR